MSEFRGYFEGVRSDGWATGWVHWTDAKRGKAQLEILVDGEPVSTIAAGKFREDLQRAGIADPACAFELHMPERYWDGAEHVIDVRLAGVSLPNTPLRFALGQPSGAGPGDSPILPNAAFDSWPHGLVVRPGHRYEEVLSGWYYDGPEGGPVAFSAERSGELGLLPGQYVVRVANEDPAAESGFRLVALLNLDPAAHGGYEFSLGLRRPAGAVQGTMQVAEVSLAAWNGETLQHLASLRGNLAPKGVMRLRGIPIYIDGAIERQLDGSQLALVIGFTGRGVIDLFAPELDRAARMAPRRDAAQGSFECENLQEQLADLVLSPIWQPGGERRPAAPPPIPVLARPAGASEGLPFTQIVVPVYNAGSDVDELIASLLAHTPAPFEILVADDGSEAFTQHRLVQWGLADPRVRVLRNAVNLGYTRNINQALQSATAEHVVLINSDTIVTEHWLARLYEALHASADTVGAGPLSNAASWQSVPAVKAQGGWALNPLPGGISVAAMGELVAAASQRAFPELPLLNGFCLLLRRDAIAQAGWFDDDSFPNGYGEENDLCLRLGKAGGKLRVADHAYVYHKKSRSFGAERRQELSPAASKILQAKHPAVSIERVEEAMRSCAPLIALRERLTAMLTAELPPKAVAAP